MCVVTSLREIAANMFLLHILETDMSAQLHRCAVVQHPQRDKPADVATMERPVDIILARVKMSAEAKTLALSLDLPPEDRAVLEQALA